MAVNKITAQEFDAEVLKSDKPVLVDFYADWCGPCKMVAPIVDEISNESDAYKVCKLNVDDAQDIAARYGVMSIPTLIVFKDGEVSQKTVGVQSKQMIQNMLA
ncbi:MAG: thioredoxin [Clostridiales bacterium]|nr:thioredoxin [Clostridiales bacterium]